MVEAGGEHLFLRDQLVDYAGKAIETLGPLYLGEAAESLQESLKFVIVRPEDEQGSKVPVVRYTSKESAFVMEIEPETILAFSEEIAESSGDEVATADVTRILIGAGVARCILA